MVQTSADTGLVYSFNKGNAAKSSDLTYILEKIPIGVIHRLGVSVS